MDRSVPLFSSTEFNSLKDLFLNQLEDLYDGENRLTKALPTMARAVYSDQLKQAIYQHLTETKNQVVRLETIFRDLNLEPTREICEAMEALIAEGETIVEAKGDPVIKDAALMAAVHRIEHYEIAGYGTAQAFALRLGLAEAAHLLGQSLREESSADEMLTAIAEASVNAGNWR